MARPKSEYGIFDLARDPVSKAYSVGPVIQRHASFKLGAADLVVRREAIKLSGSDPFNTVLLPLGPKGEGLLPVGC